MKTQDHWRYRLVVVGIAIGAVLAFWPELLTAPPTAPLSGKNTNENDIHEVSHGADMTEYLLSTEGKTEITTNVAVAAEGELLCATDPAGVPRPGCCIARAAPARQIPLWRITVNKYVAGISGSTGRRSPSG